MSIYRKLGMDKPQPGILVMDENGKVKAVSIEEKICYDLGEDSYIINPKTGIMVDDLKKSGNDIICVSAKIPLEIEVESVATIKGLISTGFKNRQNKGPSTCAAWISTKKLPVIIDSADSDYNKMNSVLGMMTSKEYAGANITNSMANLTNIYKEVHLKPGDEYIYIYIYSNTLWYDTKRDNSWGVVSLWFESVKKSFIQI